MDSSLKLFLDLFVSCLGFSYFIYGKKQRVFVPMLCGISLMVYPYFIQNLVIYLLIALILAISPFIIRE